jgi:hypothetical protein
MATGLRSTPTATTQPWLVKRGALAYWQELPLALAAGGAALVTAVPLVVAILAGTPGWLRAITTVPPALALTGLAEFAAAIGRGDRPRAALLRRLDPVLALLLAGGTALAGSGLAAGGGFAVAGAVAGAGLLLVFPYALAYGALRGRRGLAALRGGTILVAYRPVWALTLVALGCLGGFAIVASVGVLAPVILPLLLTIAATQTAWLLDEIDALQSRS